MDDQHFDNLVRSISSGVSRRRALRSALGGLVAGVAGATALSAEAKKDKNKGKAQGKDKNKGKAQGKKKNKGKDKLQGQEGVPTCRLLGENCFPPNDASHQCCDDQNLVCNHATSGQCVCKPQFFNCDGRCIHESHCCPTGGGATCPRGQTCIDNTCQCIPDGSPGNPNHPDLCCSGCLCPDGNCCNAVHCQTTTTTPAGTTTTPAGTTTTPAGTTTTAPCNDSCDGKTCGQLTQCGRICGGCSYKEFCVLADDGRSAICKHVPSKCVKNGERGLCCSGYQKDGVCCAANDPGAVAITVTTSVFNQITVNTPPTTVITTVNVPVTPGTPSTLVTTPSVGGAGRRKRRRRRKGGRKN